MPDRDRITPSMVIHICTGSWFRS